MNGNGIANLIALLLGDGYWNDHCRSVADALRRMAGDCGRDQGQEGGRVNDTGRSNRGIKKD